MDSLSDSEYLSDWPQETKTDSTSHLYLSRDMAHLDRCRGLSSYKETFTHIQSCQQLETLKHVQLQLHGLTYGSSAVSVQVVE